MDIVKHAVKAVAHMLNDDDRLAIVAFDNRAEVVMELGQMHVSERGAGLAKLDVLSPRGGTEIWKGLKLAMDTVRLGTAADEGPPRMKSILLLTDGQSSAPAKCVRPWPWQCWTPMFMSISHPTLWFLLLFAHICLLCIGLCIGL